MLGQIFSWNEWGIFEVHLTPGPGPPAFSPVDNEVTLQPLLASFPDLNEEFLMWHLFNAVLQAIKHELNVILPVTLGLVPVDVLKLHAVIVEELGSAVIDPRNCNIQSIAAILILQRQIRIVRQKKLGHSDVVAERGPDYGCATILTRFIDVGVVFHEKLNYVPVSEVRRSAHRIRRALEKLAFS